MLRKRTWVCVLGITWLVIHPITAEAEEVGTAFTYQGSLNKDSQPVEGSADFKFTLWDAESGGNLKGTPASVDNQKVEGGLFTVTLDCGVDPYTENEARWLETEVRSPSGGGGFTKLPRQKLTPTPFSLATRGINVDAAGNVGIGAADPQTALHVATTSPVLTLQDTDSSDGQRLTLKPNGYVGIGTTDPQVALDVNGTTRTRILEITGAAVGATHGRRLGKESRTSPSIRTWSSSRQTVRPAASPCSTLSESSMQVTSSTGVMWESTIGSPWSWSALSMTRIMHPAWQGYCASSALSGTPTGSIFPGIRHT